jgi:hypothetical protein
MMHNQFQLPEDPWWAIPTVNSVAAVVRHNYSAISECLVWSCEFSKLNKKSCQIQITQEKVIN